MNKYIDLHTHTIYSDGVLTPSQLVQKAAKINLAAIAISDHENVVGIEEAKEAGKRKGVEIVPAVEISSYPDSLTEHHILGYFIDYKDKKLLKSLAQVRKAREDRAKKVVKNLNDLGYSINFGDVKSLATGTIVQPHIAWVVINDLENKEKLKKDFGDIPTTGDFIRKYLIPGAPAYEARKAMTPKEAVQLIHSANGIAVFAHPCWTSVTTEGDKLIFDDKKFEAVRKAGIDGVEALAHRGSEEDTRATVAHFTQLAKKHKLLITGGSDYHGFGSAGKQLGFTDFYLKVPYEVLEDLKLRIKNRPKMSDLR
ncbi:MAG: hypothetical protein A2Z11_02520 [Candidatus Woykebacteria bacterium RBG_16_43_9]|uniref:Polymerase/histidinol phosphatase N-terminal domain-containing protein n=1 Tax=Candidatus Woykebacteria bacterium RBG_16_43_9 TaxID=1802596 RepID=A0A1G1WGV6_9BACT|nr:MAG: hypothetical protein A2Z11_02520 [Candidatus Woykebacteria bacterium RBG_16_43_9]